MRRTTALVVLLVASVFAGATQAAQGLEIAPNSGLPGSSCAAGRLYTPFTPPGAGVKSTGLGAEAPAYYEIGVPTGAFAGKPPKGVMLVIHGGGWFVVGKETLVPVRSYVDNWRARGWTTLSIDYRACGQSLTDVFWFMRRVREIRPNAVVCAAGLSAGGHLALLLASVRPDVACVISVAGPTDLSSLPNQQTFDPVTATMSAVVPTKLFNMAAAAFGGVGTLNAWSPISYAGRIKARVLLANGELDNKVPVQQATDYAAALRSAQPGLYVDEVLLPPGTQPFVHTGASEAGLLEFHAAEDALTAPLVG
jgi:acetyl esterase/lipase